MRTNKLSTFDQSPAGVLSSLTATGAVPSRSPVWCTWQPGLALLALVAALAGCGGGGSPVDSLATAAPVSAFTQGTITGFGSIIVNGVRFDERSASVTDDAGTQHSAAALALGMRVEVDSGAVDAVSATAHAAAVRYGSLVLGPVAAVDSAAGTLTVLGQAVDVSSSTVFSDSLSAGLSSVGVGAVVEVHGMVNAATGHITATRIESAAGATAYKLRGTVAALDSAAKSFTINGTLVVYGGLAASDVPSTLANGAVSRVLLATAQSGGVWVAQSLGVNGSKPLDKLAAQVRGSITGFASNASFSVDGLAVDASAASFPDGSSGLALGVAVEVRGKMSNGVLVASRVEIESGHLGDDGHAWHLFGAISAVDVTAKTLVVHGTTVSYSDTTLYVNGSLADLVVGRELHVKGAVGSTRSQVQAATITFE